VEAALKKIAGVKSAKANMKTASAKVDFDPGKTSPQRIVQAFNQNNGGGYKAAVMKARNRGTKN
jgi:copper chaperone CopZ